MNITSLIDYTPQEELCSLVEPKSETTAEVPVIYSQTNKTLIPISIREKRYFDIATIKKYIVELRWPNKINKNIKNILKLVWFGLSTSIALAITLVLLFNPTLSGTQKIPKYSIYSSKPIVAGTTTSGIQQEDARAGRIDEIFRTYNCPIQGKGSAFVKEADKNNIPYWLVAAVAFQESSCGKFTPKVEGSESSNLWGWGVWGEHIYMFEDVEEGIAVVSKYMSDKFYSQGITDPCIIMRTYTPPSQGSWCQGVKFFRDQIMDYTTPVQE